MRKVRTALLLLAIAVLTLSLGSCLGFFGWIFPSVLTYNGTDHELDKMYIVNYGQQSNGAYDIDVYLVSPGLTYSYTSGWSGSGEAIYIDLGSGRSDLEAATYSWNDSERVSRSVVYSDFTIGTLGGIASSGEVTVAKQLFGGYAIDFEFTTDQGSVKGHFTGEVTQEWQGTYSASVSGPVGSMK